MLWRRLICACVMMMVPSLAGAVSGSITVEGRVVPLPPGEWREVARDVEVRTLRYTGQSFQLGKAILVQETNGRATGMIVLSAASSNPGTTINWTVEPICRREDFYLQMTRSTDQQNMDCAAVSALMPARRRGREQLSSEWRRYFDELEANPNWIPSTWIFAAYRLTGSGNLLHVEYRFSPEANGFPPDRRAWSSNSWNPGNLDERRRAFMERFRLWAAVTRSSLWQAFQRDQRLALSPF